ncbi:MAG: hypothetical protein ACD_58C00239G0005 [uncultured bacterium]|nr:MAG: hypothetical protein ACD_58C00239G0005 [uncultured bacterium]
MVAIMGRKLGMTRIFDANGKVTPVTLIEAGPCFITQIKSKNSDGYEAVQIGFDKSKHPKKPQIGHLNKIKNEKLKVINLKYLREYQINENTTDLKVGDEINLDNFKVNDVVSITSVSKGKGFAGGVKRHGFTTGPKTHGSCNYRKPGSIGDTQPARVYKGKRMAGHMGNKQITIDKTTIVDINLEKKLIAVKGGVPGSNKTLVYINKFN